MLGRSKAETGKGQILLFSFPASMAEKSLIHHEDHQQQQEKPDLKVPNSDANKAETIDLNLEMARKIEVIILFILLYTCLCNSVLLIFTS